jgi:hypothetical protein
MDLLSALLESPARFSGRGSNHAGEVFQGVLEIQRLAAGSGVMLHYTAEVDGRPVHAESSLLARGERGLCLWPVMSELPWVLPHDEASQVSDASFVASVVFASGPRDHADRFREEITLSLHRDGKLSYAHAWGMPGGAFAERSACEMAPTDD